MDNNKPLHKFDRPPDKPPVRGYYGHYYWNGIEYISDSEAWEDYHEYLEDLKKEEASTE